MKGKMKDIIAFLKSAAKRYDLAVDYFKSPDFKKDLEKFNLKGGESCY